jgi:hypothetical protein
LTDTPETDAKPHGPDEGRAAAGQSSIAAVWQEGTPGHGVIKLSDVRASRPGVDQEVTVGNPEANNHSPSIGDHKPGEGRATAIDIAWVEAAAGDAFGPGRIMWQRFDAAKLSHAANDNATWVAGAPGIGAIGHEPTIAGLSGGDTLVAWIGPDGHAHGRMYAAGDAGAADPPHYASVNAALGDLGPVAAAGDGGRRLQIAEPRPGTFAVMWLALADSGLALRGSLFLGPPGSGPREDCGAWTEQPIADIRLPSGSTGAFSLTGAGAGSADLLVTYPVLDGAAGTVRVPGRHVDGTGDGHIGQPAPEFLIGTAAPAEDHTASAAHATAQPGAVVRPGTQQDDHPAANRPLLGGEEGAGAAAPAIAIAAERGVDERAPIVEALTDGFAVAWQTPGASDGAVQIKLSFYDAHGTPIVLADCSTVVRVTESAAAGVAPAISGWGSGAVVAYVGAGDGGLALKAYDGAGTAIGKEATVDSGAGGAISEVSIDAQTIEAGDGSIEQQIAVAYVREGADPGDVPGDYGNIYLQRYGVTEQGGEPQQLVELGIDGTQDGADAPAAIMTEAYGDPAASEPVLGRAPVVEALDGGGLAVAWVECTDNIETIKGRVLAADGNQVLLIDLTDLTGDQGIAQSTRPILSDTAAGDILVSWLQADGDGYGYVVMSARYEADGTGGWIMPDAPIRLQEFDDQPAEFSVVLSEGDATHLTVTWRADASGDGSGIVLSQSYDIDGQDVGRTTKVSEIALTGEQAATAAFSTAGLADGKIVIVYPEESNDGGVDLAAHIIDAPGVGQADPASAGDATGPVAEPVVALDTFEFAPGYGDPVAGPEVIDMTQSGSTTYQQLVDSGALVEAEGDAAAGPDPGGPADASGDMLQGVVPQVLTDDYLKFS